MNWRTIEEFPDYQVSDTGLVRNKFGKLLTSSSSNKGYLRIRMTINGKVYIKTIHRLVALAFIDNPESKPTVNHKNAIRTDNRVENLEWASYAENIRHSFEISKRKPTWKGRFGKDHTRAMKVYQYDKHGIFIKEYSSQVDASKETKISSCNISLCINNKRKSAGGFIWTCKTFH